jgi:hypothetical protein
MATSGDHSQVLGNSQVEPKAKSPGEANFLDFPRFCKKRHDEE